jgi:hypothetical protein
MSDFSKQWCDANDPDMPSDFDILEVFSRLKYNTWESWICEGYGFGAVANIDGECMLNMPAEDGVHGKWVPYEDVVF